MVKALLLRELDHFKRLQNNSRILLTAIIILNVSLPLYDLFFNAYLWRKFNDFHILAVFNLCLFAMMPIGFTICGLVLNRIPIKFIFVVSVILQVVLVLIIMLLPQISFTTVIIFGIMNGLTYGLHWGSRNLLFSGFTADAERNYFVATENALATISNIAVPPIAGLIISLGLTGQYYNVNQGYLIVVGCALGIGVLSSLVLIKGQFRYMQIQKLLLVKASRSWNYLRVANFLRGAFNGVAFFLPTLLVLYLVGNEGVLGITKSLAALIASLLIYILGKKAQIKDRLKILILGIIFVIMASLLLSVSLSALSVVLFQILTIAATPLILLAAGNILFERIDAETKDKEGARFAYILDHEILLDSGRALGIALFIYLQAALTLNQAIVLAPLVLAMLQIFVLRFVYKAQTVT